MKPADYHCWNLFPDLPPKSVELPADEAAAVLSVTHAPHPLLCYGRGRSYGDVCLNERGPILDLRNLNRILAFDPQSGLLEAEAGVTIADLLAKFVPQGWFPPTTPGTKLVTLGGAVANDVHGKNQHRAGSFGNWVESLRLLRSDGRILECSGQKNAPLFRATVGGLGLTGAILTVKLRMVKVAVPWITAENFRFSTLSDFYKLSHELHATHEFLFSWLDPARGHGVIMAGNWSTEQAVESPPAPPPAGGPDFWGGSWLLNSLSMDVFNRAYWWREGLRSGPRLEHWNTFFYPLDHLAAWNKLYGRSGFFEYQCLIPPGKGEERCAAAMLALVRGSPYKPYLSAIKRFGAQERIGSLSFSGEGTSLIFDFPNRGEPTMRLLEKLDEILFQHGGRLYPAKDARMSRASFEASFPQLSDFLPEKDSAFESAFWRRVRA